MAAILLVNETKLGSSDWNFFLSPRNNTGTTLVSCRTWKCVFTATFRRYVFILDGSWVSFVMADELLVIKKSLQV